MNRGLRYVSCRGWQALLVVAGRQSTAARASRRSRAARTSTTPTASSATATWAAAMARQPRTLTPRPRDFTSGKYKIRSTETGSVPTDDDLMQSVRQGLYGTAMPGWDRILSDDEIADVVAYIKALSPQFGTPPRPVTVGAGVPSSPESIARGQQVYDKLQCGKCHGSDGRGTGAVATTFEDDWQQPLRAADLTEPWTFHGGATARDIYLRFRTGMAGTPMPSFADAASDSRDVGPRQLRRVAGAQTRLVDERRRGQGVVRGSRPPRRKPTRSSAVPISSRHSACVVCHSPVDEQKRMLPGLRLAGGMLLRDRAVRRLSRPATSRPTRRPASATGATTRSSARSRKASCATAHGCCRFRWTTRRIPR